MPAIKKPNLLEELFAMNQKEIQFREGMYTYHGVQQKQNFVG